jgi:predicted NUDIX family phosphoesterase
MGKVALSVTKNFDPFTITIQELLNQKPFLANRPECETNFDQLQIIPYLVFVDTTPPTPDTAKYGSKYFTYMRGESSGESRLIGNCSIGIGGHVETAVSKDINFVNSVALACEAEVFEETGMRLSVNHFENAMRGISSFFKIEDETIAVCPGMSLLYNEENDVSKVHIGINLFIVGHLSAFEKCGFGTLEEGIITKGQWLTIEDLTITNSNDFVLEEWSKQVVKKLATDFH